MSFFLPSPFVLIEFKMDVTDQLIATKEFRSSMYVCVHERERERERERDLSNWDGQIL